MKSMQYQRPIREPIDCGSININRGRQKPLADTVGASTNNSSSGPNPPVQDGQRCYRCLSPAAPIEDSYPTMKTHVLTAILFCIGLPLCIFIPYMFDIGGTKVTRCPKCGFIVNRP